MDKASETILALRPVTMKNPVLSSGTVWLQPPNKQSCARSTQHAGLSSRPAYHKRPTAKGRRCSTQRAGIASPHAEGDVLSGVTSDGELTAFISVPAAFVGGVPLTRARNPWAMPEASA